MGKRGYGVDEPLIIIELSAAGAISTVTGLALPSFRQPGSEQFAAAFLLVGPVVGGILFVIAALLYWNSRLSKRREIDNLLRKIPWGGSEKVLDVGCGRGAMMVAAARRVGSGFSVGIDQWKSSALSGNNPRSVWANAREENVESPVFLVKADPRFMPFRDRTFDVIVSAMGMHFVGNRDNVEKGLKEIVRVAILGGRIAILDIRGVGTYARLLEQEGVADVVTSGFTTRSFPPIHSVVGRKPYE